MKIKNLLVASIVPCCLLASCTYDYFVDESNYRVYVPEVASGMATNCYVAVYDEKGQLVRIRRTGWPGDSDPRAAAGVFSFHLPPGKYTAYCYANVGDMQMEGAKMLAESFVAMREIDAPPRSHAYAQPSEMIFQKLTPEIGATFKQKVDTTTLEKYVGLITVKFKNMPVSMSSVARVQLEATGVATRQFFQLDTLSSRFTDADYLFDDISMPSGASAAAWEFERRYFPSISGEMTRIGLYFIDAAGDVVCSIPVEVVDVKTGRPLTLLHGQHLVIEVDRYVVVGVSLVGWDEGIKDSDRDI
ncbi:MAG: hypothetical protein LBI96_07325 [Odoribacteraceae bacterium]|nr:hypothetical protein [Odoribacteraceae bacterium]